MTVKAADGHAMGPEVFDDVEVRLTSGKVLRFSRLYLFEKSSFLQLYRFGEPWLHLLPWPAPRKHRRIVGYLQGDACSPPLTLDLDIAQITAKRRGISKEITDVAVVRTGQDPAGRLQVKFEAGQSELRMPSDEPGTRDGGA